jgi:hypothetical protein
MDIEQRVREKPVQHAVVDMAVDTVVTILTHLTPIRMRRPIHQEAVQVVKLVEVAEVQNHVGHEQVRQFITPPLKFKLLHLSAEQLKILQQCLFFGMFFYAMLGTIDRVLLRITRFTCLKGCFCLV